MFKVIKIDHIAIAVKNLQEAKKLYTDILGMNVKVEEAVFESEKVKICLIPCGETDIELVESITLDGPTAKLVDNKGGGIHHIGLLVDSIQNAVADLKAKEIRLLGEAPRKVEDGTGIAFIHPKAAGSVLIELVEH